MATQNWTLFQISMDRLCRLTVNLQNQKYKIQIFENILEAEDH